MKKSSLPVIAIGLITVIVLLIFITRIDDYRAPEDPHFPALSEMSSEEIQDAAHSYTDMGNFSAAIHHQQELVDRHPDDLHSLHFLGTLMIDDNRMGEAEEIISELVSAEPQDPELLSAALFDLGLINLQNANYNEAEEYLREALNVAPDNLGAKMELANLKMHLDAPEEAEPILLELVEDASHEPEVLSAALQNLGSININRDNFSGAEEYLRESINVNPDNLWAKMDLVNVKMHLDAMEEAEPILLELVEDASHEPEVLSVALQNLGSVIELTLH